MIKRDELSNLTSCINRARLDEMTFVLLGRDAATGSTIRFWCAQRIASGKNVASDPQIQGALADAAVADIQAEQHASVKAGKDQAFCLHVPVMPRP